MGEDICAAVLPDDETEYDIFSPGGWQRRHIAWAIAGVFTFLSIIISFDLIFRHLRNYTKKPIQRYIVRILLMVPIYAMDSWLSLRFYQHAVYFDLAKNCYEAVVIHNFTSLLINYLGGKDTAAALFKSKKVRLPLPLCCWIIKGSRTLFQWLKYGTLQYVILRVAMTIFSVIMEAVGNYCSGNLRPSHGYIWDLVIINISVTIALYALVLFYVATSSELAPFNPGLKFVAIKFVIFFIFWQTVVLSMLESFGVITDNPPYTAKQISESISNFIICVEMLLAAVIHIQCFGYKEFANPDGSKTSIIMAIRHVISLRDMLLELNVPLPPKTSEKVAMRLADTPTVSLSSATESAQVRLIQKNDSHIMQSMSEAMTVEVEPSSPAPPTRRS
mmetsp:Transcript_42510/g.68947  ORF Transcript_42510/g.68947 Transcript_42510/m.68947 type:complete len:389 (+) Transcript_42510:172-1338(+)